MNLLINNFSFFENLLIMKYTIKSNKTDVVYLNKKIIKSFGEFSNKQLLQIIRNKPF